MLTFLCSGKDGFQGQVKTAHKKIKSGTEETNYKASGLECKMCKPVIRCFKSNDRHCVQFPIIHDDIVFSKQQRMKNTRINHNLSYLSKISA